MKQNPRCSVLNSKKGNIIIDSLLFIVVLVLFGIIGVFAFYVIDNVNTSVQADTSLSNESKVLLQTATTTAPLLMDGLFTFVFVLMWILVLVSAYNLKTSPVIFGLMIILFAAVIYVGAALSNGTIDLLADVDIANAAAQLPKTVFIIDHLGVMMAFILASIALVLFGKNLFDKNPLG